MARWAVVSGVREFGVPDLREESVQGIPRVSPVLGHQDRERDAGTTTQDRTGEDLVSAFPRHTGRFLCVCVFFLDDVLAMWHHGARCLCHAL